MTRNNFWNDELITRPSGFDSVYAQKFIQDLGGVYPEVGRLVTAIESGNNDARQQLVAVLSAKKSGGDTSLAVTSNPDMVPAGKGPWYLGDIFGLEQHAARLYVDSISKAVRNPTPSR